METFLWIVGGVVVLTVVLNTAQFLFGLIFKTVIGSILALSAVIYTIFIFGR